MTQNVDARVPVSLRETGSFFLKESYPRSWSCETYRILNGGAGVMRLHAGYPFAGSTPLQAASIATADGVLLDSVEIPSGEYAWVAVMVRGNGVTYDSTNLPALDYLGAAISAVNYTTRLTAMGFLARAESPYLSTPPAQ